MRRIAARVKIYLYKNIVSGNNRYVRESTYRLFFITFHGRRLMKVGKFYGIIATVLCFTLIFCGGCGYTNTEEKQLLRIHVRADSDNPAAQAVKMQVVAAIQYYLADELKEARTYDEAYAVVQARCDVLRHISDAALRRNGFGYSATVALSYEYFPARIYGDTVVESGYYDALIVRLGTGGGDNWWCVLYPQLCYTASDTDEIVYKSLIAEAIGKYF